MQHPDEGKFHTWLDGEASIEEAASIEAHVAECGECSTKVAEARGLLAASSRIVSALDFVPSGVIPTAAPKQRAWYARAELRAAAAVMVVAGASFFVMRDRGDVATMDRIMSSPTAASSAEADAKPNAVPEPRAEVAASAPANGTAPAPVAARQTQRAQTGDARSERRGPVPTVSAPQANEAPALSAKVEGVREMNNPNPRSDSLARRTRSLDLGQVVVTGVATGAAEGKIQDLRKVRSDTTEAGARTVFEVSPGVEVTLTDTPVAAFDSQMRQRKAMASTAAPPPPPVAAQRDAAQSAPINSITWIDKRGHRMSLAGPLPKERLELLRQRLPEDQR